MNIGLVQATHTVLEKAEYGLGLLSGGTYTAASLTTKAGLAAVARRVATNFVVGEVAEKALTPVMSAGLSLLAQANINVDPNAVRAGMLSLQATGVLKKAKGKLRPFTPPSPKKALQKAIKDKGAARADLNAHMHEVHGSQAMAGQEAHHAIPLQLAGESGEVGEVIRKAAKGGFNFNSAVDNGLIAPAGHGPHGDYTTEVRSFILINRNLCQKPAEAAGFLRSLVDDIRSNPRAWGLELD